MGKIVSFEAGSEYHQVYNFIQVMELDTSANRWTDITEKKSLHTSMKYWW